MLQKPQLRLAVAPLRQPHRCRCYETKIIPDPARRRSGAGGGTRADLGVAGAPQSRRRHGDVIDDMQAELRRKYGRGMDTGGLPECAVTVSMAATS